ncbi:MAG: hypothetical protein GYA56_09775 [Geobacteraceae bacterium]|nr:hypothetical protein [Geobacteraceae bacterium]
MEKKIRIDKSIIIPVISKGEYAVPVPIQRFFDPVVGYSMRLQSDIVPNVAARKGPHSFRP